MKKFVLFAFLCLFLNGISMIFLYFNPTAWVKAHEGYWIGFFVLDIALLGAVFSMIRKRWSLGRGNTERLC